MATVKDVADLANVSTATVSRVLNNQNNVSAETREAVMRAARELGYQIETIYAVHHATPLSVLVLTRDMSETSTSGQESRP